MAISKTQIDRLGERLKEGSRSEDDLRLLEEYRLSFGEAYNSIIQKVRVCGLAPTGRLAKTTQSIVDKLRRESIRLSQMQDVAGCRVVVADIIQQDKYVATLQDAFPGACVIDRREKPSHGYRAVHIIAEELGKPVEIQVRSTLQHLWAELSEKMSDVLDPTIKYGGGSKASHAFLSIIYNSVAGFEKVEKDFCHLCKDLLSAEECDDLLKHLASARLGDNLHDLKMLQLQRCPGDYSDVMAHNNPELNELLLRLNSLYLQMSTDYHQMLSDLEKMRPKGEKQ